MCRRDQSTENENYEGIAAKLYKKEEWKYTITNWPDAAVIPAWIASNSFFLTVLLVACDAWVFVYVCGVRLHAASSGYMHIHILLARYVCRGTITTHCVSIFQFTHLSSARLTTHTTRTGIDQLRNEWPWKEGETTNTKHIHTHARLLHNKSRWRNHDNGGGGTWTKIFVQALPRQCAQRNIKSFYLLYAKVHNCFSYVLVLFFFFHFRSCCFVLFARSLYSVCAVVSGTQKKTTRRPECGWLQCMQFIFEYQIL